MFVYVGGETNIIEGLHCKQDRDIQTRGVSRVSGVQLHATMHPSTGTWTSKTNQYCHLLKGNGIGNSILILNKVSGKQTWAQHHWAVYVLCFSNESEIPRATSPRMRKNLAG